MSSGSTYRDTTLGDHAAEIATEVIQAYLAAGGADAPDPALATTVAAYRAAIARYSDDEDDDIDDDEAEEDTALVRRVITVYERAASLGPSDSPLPDLGTTAPLLDLVQGVTDLYRRGRPHEPDDEGDQPEPS